MSHERRLPRMGERGWYPDHDAERRADYTRTTPEQRVTEAIELSRFATKLGALGYDQLGGRRGERPEELHADAILRTLLAHEVEFVVSGYLAVAAHGYPRATSTIEIVPSPTAENQRRLSNAMDELQTMRSGPVAAIAASYDEMCRRALHLDIPDVGRVAVASYEDVVTTKRATDSPEDRVDLNRLAYARGERLSPA